LPGYTADKQTVKAHVNADGTITVLDGAVNGAGYVTYTANQVTLPVTVPTNLGDKTIEVVGRSGETVQGKVPAVEGYTADKETVTVHISADGTTATTDESVTYTPNTVTGDVLIHSNMGDQIVPNVTGKTGETVKVTVPVKPGYTADKTTVDATVNPNGTITVIDGSQGGKGFVTYSPNDVTGDVTVKTNLGDKTVHNVSGRVGSDVQVATPVVPGYTADKAHFTAHINADGTITTTDTIVYTKVKDPDQPGGNPDQPGGNPDQPGGNPDQPGGNPDQPGGKPDQPGGNPDQPGGKPDQPGGKPEQPGKPGGNPSQPGQPETKPDESDNIPGQGNPPAGKQPGKPGETAGTGTIQQVAHAAASKGKLPQTDESRTDSRLMSVIGLSLIGLMGVVSLIARRRNRDTTD
jgi:hypothetical protein